MWLRLVAMSTVPLSRNFFNSLLIPTVGVDKVTESSKMETFLGHSVV